MIRRNIGITYIPCYLEDKAINSYLNHKKSLNIEELVALEVDRISKLYGKSFLDCDDLVQLTGLGRDNVRALMNSDVFPVTKVGRRKVVSVLAFITWQLT